MLKPAGLHTRRAALALALLPAAAGAVEWTTIGELSGGPGWRVAFGQDYRAPGFEAVTGGAELDLGVEFAGVAAVVAAGRIRAGALAGDSYFEAAGDLGAQIRLGERARVRAGAEVGRGWHGKASSLLAGGWLALGLDLFPFANNRAAAALIVRVDLGGFLDSTGRFPAATVALSGGIGGRY